MVLGVKNFSVGIRIGAPSTAHSSFNFKLSIFVAILQVLKFEFRKFRIFEFLNFHPWFWTFNMTLEPEVKVKDILYVFMIYVPVNNFSVMLGQ